jgi:hypothetical protein
MKFFIAFLILCFLGGLLFHKARPKLRYALLVVACLLLCFAYFFLNKL